VVEEVVAGESKYCTQTGNMLLYVAVNTSVNAVAVPPPKFVEFL
jgi:hypothetical protein